MKPISLFISLLVLVSCGSSSPDVGSQSPVTPVQPTEALWNDLPNGSVWTTTVLAALDGPGAALVETVPKDVGAFCPGFATASRDERKAFWVGFLSVLTKQESTWREDVSGGDGRWHGLLQISPATAEGYGCEAVTADGLLEGSANLRCGTRVMATTVQRDGVIAEGRGGVAADWGPLTRAAQKDEIADFTRSLSVCQ